jgi:glycosyltransferase involved in cell wall biosynthesis
LTTQNIIISLLIPTYNNLSGLIKIFDSLDRRIPDNIEIIISDDSDNNEILDYIVNINIGAEIKFQRNIPSLGAVNNWNNLLNISNGDFFILLHHDEFFGNWNPLTTLLNFISSNPDTEVFIFNLLKKSPIYNKLIPNTSYFLKRFAIFYPTFNYRRNVFGPLSCFMIKRSSTLFFDVNLKWYVDVDYYYRLLSNSDKIKILNKFYILTAADNVNSITNKLKPNLINIKLNEGNYLLGLNYKLKYFFSNKFYILRLIDNCIWYSYRAIWLLLVTLFYNIKTIFKK